jgi:hypothetical protein
MSKMQIESQRFAVQMWRELQWHGSKGLVEIIYRKYPMALPSRLIAQYFPVSKIHVSMTCDAFHMMEPEKWLIKIYCLNLKLYKRKKASHLHLAGLNYWSVFRNFGFKENFLVLFISEKFQKNFRRTPQKHSIRI